MRGGELITSARHRDARCGWDLIRDQRCRRGERTTPMPRNTAFLTSLDLKLFPCMPCFQKARTLSWRHTVGGDKGKTGAQKAARHFLRPLLCESSPTHSMEKSKLSSEASFLLDFSLPWRFTIFKFSAEKNKKRLRLRLPELLPSAEEVLTVQTHQHRVPLQLGDVDRVHLPIIWGKKKKK